MLAKTLNFHNFRMLGDSGFEFGPGVTVIFGSNATGKTSLLEALGYSMRARSFLGAKDFEIPTFGNDTFSIEAVFGGEKSLQSKVSWDGRKTVSINGKSVRSTRELTDTFKMVSITPLTSLIATGSPSARREFLDDTASQINSSWAATISEYKATLADRNAWFKTESGGRDMLAVLTENLIRNGLVLRQIRNDTASMLSEYVCSENIEFSCESKGQLNLAEFKKVYAQEKAREQTVIGPHKDDWSLLLSGHKVDRFASTGEARRVTLALKLAQARLIRQIVKIEPVILADDLFAELDSDRAKDALERVSAFGQAFITCAQKPPQGDYVLLESDRWASQNR